MARDFSRKYGFELGFTPINQLESFVKYLLQGGTRSILEENGSRPCTISYDKHDFNYRWEEGVQCQCDGIKEGTGEEVAGSSGGNSKTGAPTVATPSARTLRALKYSREIADALLRYRCKDEQQLSRKIQERGSTDEKEWLEILMQEAEWQKLFTNARTNIMTKISSMYWKDIMEQLPDDPQEYDDNTMSIERSIKYLMKVLQCQGWEADQRLEFVKHIFAVVDNNIFREKRNTLYYKGVSNAGKSLIANSIADSCMYTFHTGEYNR